VWDFEGVSRLNTCNVLGGSGDLLPQKIINFRVLEMPFPVSFAGHFE